MCFSEVGRSAIAGCGETYFKMERYAAAVLAAYRDHFGIDLNSVPEPVVRRDPAS